MEFTAKQIADLIQGTIEGDEKIKVNKLAKIEEGVAGAISFLANPLYTNYIYTTQASIVIVNNSFIAENTISATLIRVEDAYSSFALLLDAYNQIKQNKKGIAATAVQLANVSLGKDIYLGDLSFIGENAIIGNNAKIYPQVFIGDNVQIGENTIIFPGVKIYSDTVVGKNCTIHAGAVIGADGFGFAPQDSNNYKKVAQIGNVIIEDNVEIGANTSIDRATLGSTIIRKGVKLDNLIQIAHNVEIGENTVIASQTGVSGSTKIGKNCMIGGQVGITGHLIIGDNVKIAAQSGIGASLKENDIVQGSPAFEISKYRKTYIHFRNLISIVKRIDDLEKKINQ